MSIIGRAGKLLIGGTFVLLGYGAIKDPSGRATMAAPALEKIREYVPLPDDDELLVRLNGVVMTGAGATLAIGLFPRLSALALAGALIPTTYAGHAFWTIDDKGQRAAQRTQFLKNAAMLGGLLLAVGDRKRPTASAQPADDSDQS